MEAKLIKIDRNGSKHFEGDITCDRCGGRGYYAIGVMNGHPVLSPHDGGVCWKCGGTGKVHGKWIERTAEYQAKLDARRAERQAKRQAEWEAKQAELDRIRKQKEAEEEAKRLAEEARIKALKAISQYVGEVGEKLDITGTHVRTAWFDVRSFSGYGTDRMYVHTFKDADGNVIVWKTSKWLDLNEGDSVRIRGTVKEHSEYKDEKQTALTRCKIEVVDDQDV